MLILLLFQISVASIGQAQTPGGSSPTQVTQPAVAGSAPGLVVAPPQAPATAAPVQGSPLDPVARSYRELIGAAVAEFEAQAFAEALELFEQAHRLDPNARTLRGIGKVNFELHNYSVAERDLEAALVSQVRPLTAPMRAEVQALLQRARAYVGTLEVSVSEPDVAHVFLIDNRVTTLPPGGRLRINLGEYQFELRADGYQVEKRRVAIRGGDVTRLVFQLRPQVPTAAAQAQATQEKARPSQASKPAAGAEDGSSIMDSPWLWTGVGAVVIGGVVGAVLALSETERVPADPTGGLAGESLKGP